MVHVSYKQIPEDAGLIEIPQPDHVVDALHRGDVHVSQLLRAVHPVLSAIVVHQADASTVRGSNLGSYGHCELAHLLWLNPHMVSL